MRPYVSLDPRVESSSIYASDTNLRQRGAPRLDGCVRRTPPAPTPLSAEQVSTENRCHLNCRSQREPARSQFG
jgi:hypothetical protein